MTAIVTELPLVTEAERARIFAAPRTAEAHRALMADIPAMTGLEMGGTAPVVALPDSFNVAAWNVERCLFPEASADLLARHDPHIVLLSEMDSGMARTGQRNTTAEMARHLGMAHVYGVEFFEMGLGGPTERDFCTDQINAAGWHGNAILSRVPFERATLIRLDEDGHWFCNDVSDPEQQRVGGRMAIAALLSGPNGPICVVTTHLESNADAEYRYRQFERLLDAIDAFAPDTPVLIGGDLNTGNHLPPDFDWRRETLFDLARARDYDWGLTPKGPTTRPSLITPHPTRTMTLDWFCARGLGGVAGPLVPALDPTDRPLSDHECIVCTVEV